MNPLLRQLDDRLLFSSTVFDVVVLDHLTYADWRKAKVPHDDYGSLHGVSVVEGQGKSYLIESSFDGPLIHML